MPVPASAPPPESGRPEGPEGPAPLPTDAAGALREVRAALHDLTNLLQPVIGVADLLALRPAVNQDPVAAGHVRSLVASAERAIAQLAALRRLTRAADASLSASGAPPETPPEG